MSDVEVITGCPTPTRGGGVCKMRPTSSGYCLNHEPSRAEARQAERSRGGKLARARQALAKAKSEAIAKLGVDEELPDLADVERCQRYLVTVAQRVESRALSPMQANSLVGIVKLSKDLLGLQLDIKLAERLEELERQR